MRFYWHIVRKRPYAHSGCGTYLGMVFKTQCSPLWFEGVRSGTISAWKNKLNWDGT